MTRKLVEVMTKPVSANTRPLKKPPFGGTVPRRSKPWPFEQKKVTTLEMTALYEALDPTHLVQSLIGVSTTLAPFLLALRPAIETVKNFRAQELLRQPRRMRAIQRVLVVARGLLANPLRVKLT